MNFDIHHILASGHKIFQILCVYPHNSLIIVGVGIFRYPCSIKTCFQSKTGGEIIKFMLQATVLGSTLQQDVDSTLSQDSTSALRTTSVMTGTIKQNQKILLLFMISEKMRRWPNKTTGGSTPQQYLKEEVKT